MIEADLERYFKRDLCDLYRGRMTMRKVRVLIDGLPPESATVRALSGVTGPLSQWSLSEVLAARLLDEMAFYRWEWGSAHHDEKKGGKFRPPPVSVLPRQTGTKASEVAHRDDIPIVSPHRLGGFVNGGDDN